MRWLIFISVIMLAFGLKAQSTLLQQADSSYASGNFGVAYDQYKKSGDDFFTKNAFNEYARAYIQMADCKLQSGDPFHAKGLIENTLKFIETSTSVVGETKAQALTILGLIHLNLGRNDEALEELFSANTLFSKEDSRAKANCLDALGQVYVNNENKQLAIQYLEQAFKMRRKIFGVQSVEVGNSYNNLGQAYIKDDPLQSIIYFNRAKGIYEKKLGASSRRALRSQLNIAFADMEQGNFDDALEKLNEVRDVYDATYEGNHPNKAFIQSIIGRVFLLKKEYQKSEINQKEALTMYIALFGEKHPEVANSYYLMGEVMRAKAEYKEAVAFYQRSIYANLSDQSFNDVYELPRLANYFNSDILLRSIQAKAIALADLHFEKSLNVKDIVGAIDTYRKCDDLITIIRRQRLTEQDKLRLGNIAKEVYENAIDLSLILSQQSFNRKKHVQTAFDFCERSKSSVLLEAITESKAKKFAGIPANQIILEDSLKDEISFLEQQLALPENIGNQEMKDRYFTYQNSYRDFISNLERNFPEYYKLKYDTEIASVASVQKHLSTNAALISYFIGDDNLYIFTITQNNIKAERKDKEGNLDRLTKALRNTIKYSSQTAFIKTAKNLYQQLMPELSAGIEELIILPDGALGTIPFEALVLPKEGTTTYESADFLLEKYHISYDYSATLFNERHADDDQVSPQILLIAPVDFKNHDVSMSSLPGSESEVNEIKYVFAGNNCQSKVQTKTDASEFNFKKEDLTKYRYVHFATHGIVNESEPALSRIFLNKGQDEDGSLYTGEIYNLTIDADLVTLSACETGLGKVAKGEGIVGLSRALQYAGANNIIVSLWQVADKSTSEMMIAFYKYNLNNDHHGYNTALRQAKLSLLRSEDYSKPFYWAPFILVGM